MENKKRKALIIIICCSAFFLAGTTILLFFMLQKEKNGFDTPEAAAEKIMNASVNKDWKTIIDLTTDDTLEMLLQADAEKVKAKDISSAAQLRDWAEQNAATVPDPMNGKTILQYSLGETQTIIPCRMAMKNASGAIRWFPSSRMEDGIRLPGSR